jgi:hypothetical protein
MGWKVVELRVVTGSDFSEMIMSPSVP